MNWEKKQARTTQLSPEGDWLIWLILSGRGFGKTRAGAEWLAWEAVSNSKTRWAVVAKTFADARDTCLEGESGLVSVLNRYGVIDVYNRSIGEIRLLNGTKIRTFSAEEPDRLRGPQFHGAWCDELAAWNTTDTWDQLQFGLRLGKHPRTVVTTTPRPIPLIKELVTRDSVVVSRGSTFENAENLAPAALAELQTRYAATRLGRQELYGEILTDVPGALWTRDLIERTRLQTEPPMVRIVIGVDPAVTSGESSDSTGIVVAGATADGHFYVLEDSTFRATPEQWASKVAVMFEKYKADRVIAEVNNGGDLVSLVLRNVNPNIPIKTVNASRGKRVRAEPISAMYEQFRVHHVGYFADLEDQMCEWTPDSNKSPDNLDAMVWALTELSSGNNAMMSLASLANFCPNCRMPVAKQSAYCPSCNTPMQRE